METLLWGGDELVWVVPAWVGWWTLEFFYQNSAGWPFNQELLTHAAGIVFCHHNAPIHRIKELAHNLAELAKDKSRKESFFAYQRLESFDHIGKDIYAYINDTYGGRVKPVDLVLSGANMLGIAENIRILKNNDFSKSGMYRIVQAIISGSDDVNDIAKKIAKSAEVEKALKNLEGLLNGEKAMWLHLAELWDYIV